jgi:hypothetical protein
MFQDRHGHLRHDATRPEEWGQEMLGYLREHDQHFERFRHEYMRRLDEQYLAWRREEVSEPPHRSDPAARTSASPEPSGVAMPLQSDELDRGVGAIEPDADAPAHRAALERFHSDPERVRR